MRRSCGQSELHSTGQLRISDSLRIMLRVHTGLVTVSLLALTGAVCVLRPDEWDLFTALFASVAIGQWAFLIAALTSTYAVA